MKKILLLFVFLSLSLASFAQRKITGKIVDGSNNDALVGATVIVKDTKRGVQADVDGTFTIQADKGEILVASYVGYLTKEIVVDVSNSVDIMLDVDTRALQEVVVTGYGGALNKREITGAISKIKGEDFENLPVQSFDRALQGRAAGVQVTSANGVPGGAVQVRIRGVGSIGAGNDPLYIVDGVQLNSGSRSSFTSSNPLNFLNPNDIESMEVLKDAAAASIYGSQAANGVVLITTKKGKAGKTKIDFNYYKGIVEPIQQLGILNSQDWIKMRTEAVQNSTPTATPLSVRQTVLGSIRLPTDYSDAQIAAVPTYDWQNVAFRKGVIDNYEMSLSGGNDKTKFYFSGAYNQQDANLINVDFKRGTSSLKLTHEASKKLTIETALNLSTTTSRGQFGSSNGGSFLGASAFSSSLVLPMNPFYKDDGSYFGTPADGGLAGILNQNVLMVSELNTIKATINQIVGSVTANYKITDNLVFRPFVGIDYGTIKGFNYTDPRTADAFNVRGRVSTQFDENTNFLTNATLNYNKRFNGDKHNLGALLGVEYRTEANEGTSTTSEGFPTPAFKYPNSAANPIGIGGFWTGYSKAAVFGQARYSFNSRYFLQGVMRYDGSSRFGKNTRWGLFPSISGAWVISEENLFKGVKALDELKFRASYGETGNDQIGNFPSLGLFGGGVAYAGIGGISASSIANPDLQWERNVETSLGLEFSFLKNIITGQIDVFERKSKDLLLAQALPQISGYSSITSNVGEVQNRGIEFELNLKPIKTKDFSWDINFNITKLENKVNKLYDGISKTANKDSLTILPGNTSVILGKPLGAIFTAEYAGVNPATGRAMWYDENGNPTYVVRNPGDFKYIGSSLSTLYGGFTNSFNFRGLELSAFFQYDIGRLAINNQGAFLSENGGRLFNSLQSVYDQRWQKPGDLTEVPRPINGNAETRASSNFTGTRALEDASYLRLKTVSVSYAIPTKILARTKVLNEVRFYAQGFNLWTMTNWTGYDPEWINLGSGNNGVVPQSKSYTFGVQVKF